MRNSFYLKARANMSQQEQIDEVKSAVLLAIPNGIEYESLVIAFEELLESIRKQSPRLFERRGKKL